MTLSFLVWLLLALNPPSASPPPPARAAASPLPAAVSPDELFSRRALRQARLLIQMRLLQLRDERLECIREALRHELPDALWPEVPSPSRGAAGVAEAAARCEQLLHF
jgi:hypothetical protein